MNERIKELAKQAGLKKYQEQAPGIDGVVGNWADLEFFSALVAAQEREECWRTAENYDTGYEAAEAIRKRVNTQGEQHEANSKTALC